MHNLIDKKIKEKINVTYLRMESLEVTRRTSPSDTQDKELVTRLRTGLYSIIRKRKQHMKKKNVALPVSISGTFLRTLQDSNLKVITLKLK
jgi:hypothetical protein